MTGKRQKIYIDSDLIIAWMEDEDTTDIKIRDGVDELFRSVENGQAHLVVSTIHKPECKSIRKFIDVLFRKRSKVTPVVVTLRIAEKARDYMEAYGLKPHDAIHLATAVVFECAHFYAKDQKLLRVRQLDKTKVCLPPGASQPTLVTVSTHAKNSRQSNR